MYSSIPILKNSQLFKKCKIKRHKYWGIYCLQYHISSEHTITKLINVHCIHISCPHYQCSCPPDITSNVCVIHKQSILVHCGLSCNILNGQDMFPMLKIGLNSIILLACINICVLHMNYGY